VSFSANVDKEIVTDAGPARCISLLEGYCASLKDRTKSSRL
jgi:hypothetical protein